MRNLIFYLLLLTNMLVSQTWVQLSDVGSIITGTTAATVPIKEALCFSMKGKIYVIGAVTPTSITPTAMVWEYDPAIDSWKEKAGYPGLGNLKLTGFAIGDNIYVGTGTNNSNSTVFFNDFHKYNTVSDSWATIANFPTVRIGATGFSIGSKGYVCCGSISYTSNPTDLWAYDTTSNSWQQKASFPGVNRVGASVFTALNQGFVGLGYTYSLIVWNSDFYKYDPVSNTWSGIATFPGQGRLGAGAVSVNNFGIVFCGNDGMPVLNDCYTYNPTNDNWSNYISFGGAPRSNLLFGSVGNKVFAGGGNGVGGGGIFKDWWSLQSEVGISENTHSDETLSVYQIDEYTIKLKHTDDTKLPLNFEVYNSEGIMVINETLLAKDNLFHINASGLYIIRFKKETIKPMKFIVR